MNYLSSIFSESKNTFRLSLPLITQKLTIIFRAWLLIGMFAQLGIAALAVGGLALTIATTLMSFLIGLFTAVGAALAREENKKAVILQNAFFLGMLFSIPASLLFWYIAPLLQLTGQSPIIAHLTGDALRGFSISVPLITITLIIYQCFISQLKTRQIMICSLINTLIIIVFSYLFLIHGKYIAGYGWAVFLSYFILSVVLLLHFSRNEKELLKSLITNNFFSGKEMLSLWKLGWPIGVKYGIEVAIFVVIALLISPFGPIALATQQILLQLIYISGMTADAVGNITLIKISRCFNKADAPSRILVSSLLLITLMLLICFTLLTFASGSMLPLLIKTNTQKVMQLIHHTIPWVILFFFFDGWRMIMTSAQIGLKDPLYPLMIEIICFWGIALPLGYFTAHHLIHHMNAYWFSLVIGIALNIMLLGFRFYQKTHKRMLTWKPQLS